MSGDGGRARHHEIVDFVILTREQALALIAEGATNGLGLLEQAWLSTAEAERELRAGRAPQRP